MFDVFTRNDVLEQVLKYWNHNEESCIGLGLLERNLSDNDVFVHTKSWGREDLYLINVSTTVTINGKEAGPTKSHRQYAIEPPHLGNPSFKESDKYLYDYVKEWYVQNKKEIKAQLDFLEWWRMIEFTEVPLDTLLKILNEYKYNDAAAEGLYELLGKQLFE